ncbi:MAG: DUF3313 family protein [Gammaproteobacteria bacterium]|nr:DUF3313 domain-containing protein [Gammaproteobacteria bacterium]NND54437.1 DUF3313 family protein [Gammaproteobacteria bacterium]
MIRQILVVIGVSAGITAAGCAVTEPYPSVTERGLPRVEDKRLDAVYWQPGVELSGYNKIIVEAAEVSFRENWQRDQNAERRSPNRWVKDDDMARIRGNLAERVNEIFVAELTENGGFEVVTEPGPDVLRLTPEVVDLDIYAPDLFEPNSTRYFVEEAGRMTLRLDLEDAATGEPVGRIIDTRRARNYTDLRRANSVTNRVETDAMLRRWASLLRDALTVNPS